MGKGSAPSPLASYVLKKKLEKNIYRLPSDKERVKNRSELCGISAEQAARDLGIKGARREKVLAEIYGTSGKR